MDGQSQREPTRNVSHMIGSHPSQSTGRAFLVALFAAICVLSGCGDKTNSKKDTSDVSPPPPAQKDVQVATSDVSTRDDASTRDLPPLPEKFVDVGVPACDDYIKRQRTCVEEHAPKGIRKPQLMGLRAVAAKWAEAASVGRKNQLAQTCAQMIAASKQATISWGCKW